MTLLPISHGIHCWLITWDVTCTRTAKSKENTASFCRDGLGTASKVYVDTACFVCVSVYVCQSLKTRVSIQIQVPKYQENTFSNRWDREGRWDDLFDHWLASPRRCRILLLSFPLSRRLCLGHVQCLCKQFVDGRHMAGNVCSSFARFTHDMTRWTKEVDMTESLKLRSKYKARATSLKGFIKFHRVSQALTVTPVDTGCPWRGTWGQSYLGPLVCLQDLFLKLHGSQLGLLSLIAKVWRWIDWRLRFALCFSCSATDLEPGWIRLLAWLLQRPEMHKIH